MALAFFSYSQGDWDPYLERFFRDMQREIGYRAALAPTEICFWDRDVLDIGDNWRERTLQALSNSPVLV